MVVGACRKKLRLAVETILNPGLLDGGGPGDAGLFDKKTGEQITQERLRQAMLEYNEIISYCLDLEAGIFTITHNEYLRLPNALLQARRIIKKTIHEYRQEHLKDYPKKQ